MPGRLCGAGDHRDEKAMMTLLQSTGSAQVRKDRPALFEQMARHHPREPMYRAFVVRAPIDARGAAGVTRA
jgi:hypothetical protein